MKLTGLGTNSESSKVRQFRKGGSQNSASSPRRRGSRPSIILDSRLRGNDGCWYSEESRSRIKSGMTDKRENRQSLKYGMMAAGNFYVLFCLALLSTLFLFSCFSGVSEDGTDDGETPEPTPVPGQFVDEMWNTYYFLVDEEDYPAGDDYTLYDIDCEPLADVSEEFFETICDEGAGILRDGRLINNDRTCDCGPQCPLGYTTCYMVMDRSEYPWGVGANDNPVTPLRSWAVDNSLIPFKAILYSPGWDGLEIPQVGDLGGFTHDGCFRADDADSISGRVTGNHYDFFAGSYRMWLAMEDVLPTSSYVDVYFDDGRCGYLGE